MTVRGCFCAGHYLRKDTEKEEKNEDDVMCFSPFPDSSL